jgi:hypothetical protein
LLGFIYVHKPDKWLVIKAPLKKPFYKLFGVWAGGFDHGDSWKMNSGIEKVEKDGDYFLFRGFSGSVYVCHKGGYGSTAYGYGVIKGLEIMPEDTDWLNLGGRE